MKKTLFTLAALIVLLISCTERIDVSARYVFKDETVMSYLNHHSDYEEYVRLLNIVPISKRSKSTVAQLMSARGNYTVFAPTNKAIEEYLEQLTESGLISEPTWDAFATPELLDSIQKVIVYNSIIDGGDDTYYGIGDFPQKNNGEFGRSTLNDRKLSVYYGDDPDSIFINRVCPINSINRDILTINGMVHQVERVIAPREVTMANLFEEQLNGQASGFLVMAKLCKACGLLDTLSKIRDEVYENLYQSGQIRETVPANGMASVTPGYSTTPEHRKYGFTIFAEPDSFWEQQLGKLATDITPADIQQWVADKEYYPEFQATEDYTDFNNLLYQWTTYHVLGWKLGPDRLVFHYCEHGYNFQVATSALTIPVMEYYTTMGKRRLLKIYESPESQGIYLNRFPIIDNARRGTGHEIGCDPDKLGIHINNEDPTLESHTAINGYLYAIDAPLAYDEETRNNLSRQRIRMDAMSWFPEAMNNDIRCMRVNDPAHGWVHIPYDLEYHYFKDLNINEGSTFVYCNGYGHPWGSYCADEIKCVGRWEIMFRLPPFPKRGTYEIRYRVLSNSSRGVAQVYFGENPEALAVAGIPIDLTMGGSNPRTGWRAEADDDDYNAETDKQMRNNGYMKGEHGIDRLNASGVDSRCDNSKHIIRHIVVRQTMDPDKTYYFKLKAVLDKEKAEFYMDGLEYCPKEVYDNPEDPEDIW